MNVHGGSDAGPTPAHDFSSNASPLGPPPELLRAVLAADRSRYPDPAYTALREHLGADLAVAAERVLPCSGGAEAIRRLSLAALLSGIREVWVPQPGFGDYAAAAQALGLNLQRYRSVAELCSGLGPARALVWVCEPCNPSGSSLSAADWQDLSLALERSAAVLAIDLAYDSLRLDSHSALPAALQQRAWRLHCPNKVLGLTGVRAACLLAPQASGALLLHAQALAPSWVLSSEGCELLRAWRSRESAEYLRQVQETLRGWRDTQRLLLADLGWQQQGSCSNFWLARPPAAVQVSDLLPALRRRGIKLRDASSFGLLGWLRLSTQNKASQAALKQALEELQR
ncbi:histidinol-phosphate aminotransferase [Paucibacter oligotrophus]|uniref:histidinol-phosphate transaminase n=1 Tax=Roseateles oligotrophus TaxID=1769250 RepID=A0A840LHW5_9BURK|nr:aminotransferase class I/II-fold pyridoxal phosphate-dependent enzyme [Roseateles oligotrophus]MBB4845788.1 histidinol-phosphate aminotransferase [Roseateles oligotrophus]